MDERRWPGPVLLTLMVFSLFMLLQSISFRHHMQPVLWYDAHPGAADRTLHACDHRPPGDADCLAAWESQNPIERPLVYRWLRR